MFTSVRKYFLKPVSEVHSNPNLHNTMPGTRFAHYIGDFDLTKKIQNYISVGQYWVRIGVDNILGSRKYSFSAPRRPFRMTGYVFNAYGSRAIDSALFYNSISRGSSSKDIESNVVTTFDVVKPFLLIRRKWASVYLRRSALEADLFFTCKIQVNLLVLPVAKITQIYR